MDKQKKLDEILYAKLNHETAQMAWKDLERFFASGSVVAVGRDLDLIDVAVRFANDDRQAVAQWLADGNISKVTDAQALAWNETNKSLWTVVVKPWILVQEDKAAAPSVH